MSKNLKVVATICLYGNRNTGAGYIAQVAHNARTTGTGDPVKNRSFTEAVFMAIGALCELTFDFRTLDGVVRIFDAGGERCADVDPFNVPAYGAIVWKPAPVLTIKGGFDQHAIARNTCPDETPVKAKECRGHPAGEFDPMGVTVYCDGSCR
jgi:hypothetical protein